VLSLSLCADAQTPWADLSRSCHISFCGISPILSVMCTERSRVVMYITLSPAAAGSQDLFFHLASSSCLIFGLAVGRRLILVHGLFSRFLLFPFFG